MTTIAFDGKTLAADKRTSFGGLHATTIKVHRVNGLLVAGCGTSALICEMRAWLESGADPKEFPAAQRDTKECASVLVIHPNGDIRQYESSPYPLVILDKHWAIGSGRDFAMAAMYLGKTAVEAVEVASVFDTNTGNGVDSLELA
jgi:hypothetical protein